MAENKVKKILFVDDEQAVIGLMKNRLNHMGHQVIIAVNAAQALEKAKREKPTVIVLDHMLPGKKGTEICRDLKADANTREIPVIMFTAHTSADFEAECVNAGAVAICYKPDVAELMQYIGRILKGQVLDEWKREE